MAGSLRLKSGPDGSGSPPSAPPGNIASLSPEKLANEEQAKCRFFKKTGFPFWH
jgi:hypothetical protein